MQVALPPTPARVQLGGLKVPVLLLVKLTIPRGITGEGPWSVTVATQSLLKPRSTEEAQVREVVVGFLMKMTIERDGGEEPNEFVAVAVMLWAPKASGDVVIDQFPVTSETLVPTEVAPSKSVIVTFCWETPVIVGVLVWNALPDGVVIDGGGGAQGWFWTGLPSIGFPFTTPGQ